MVAIYYFKCQGKMGVQVRYKHSDSSVIMVGFSLEVQIRLARGHKGQTRVILLVSGGSSCTTIRSILYGIRNLVDKSLTNAYGLG